MTVTVENLLAQIHTTEDTGFSPSRYPNTYAYDFLKSFPYVLPGALTAPESRAEAARVLDQWAKLLGTPREGLATTLADAYLQHWHITRPEPAPHADPDAGDTPDGLCWSWGPRIGDDTRPVCKEPFGHDGGHRGFDGSGFESETWGAPRMPVPEHLR